MKVPFQKQGDKVKYLIILLLLGVSLWGDGFKYYKYVDNSMSSTQIIDTIKNVPNETVVVFKNGDYDFHNEKLEINNKHYIALVGDMKRVSLMNLKLYVSNSQNINIYGFKFQDSSIGLWRVKESIISAISLIKTEIALHNSVAKIEKILSQQNYKYVPIFIEADSIVWLDSVDIYNALYVDIYVKDSSVKLTNSNISNDKANAIEAYNTKLFIKNTNFNNPNYEKVDKNYAFVAMFDKSVLWAVQNHFSNYLRAIGIVQNSKAYIENNDFDKFNISILSANSKLIVVNNRFENSIGDYGKALYLSDSIATIDKNEFSKIYYALDLSNNSKANITNNTFIEPISQKYYKDGETRYYNGAGIDVEKNCMANIRTNTAVNFKAKYIGFVSKSAKVYLKDNSDRFIYYGSGNDPESQIPLPIDNPTIDDFRKLFDKVQYTEIEYKLLREYKEVKKQSHIKKGYLLDDIIVTVKDAEDSYEDEISKDTYMEFDLDTHKIIKPQEYSGIELDEEPPLKIDAKQRKIDIVPKRKTIHSKYLYYFQITSNTDISKILFDGKELKFTQADDSYTSKKRRIKDFSKEYDLLLSGDNFSLKYKCSFDTHKNLICKKQRKKQL